jgi:hypothetical protein
MSIMSAYAQVQRVSGTCRRFLTSHFQIADAHNGNGADTAGTCSRTHAIALQTSAQGCTQRRCGLQEERCTAASSAVSCMPVAMPQTRHEVAMLSACFVEKQLWEKLR